MLVIGEATDGLTTPDEMLGLAVLAIPFGDGDQMIEAIIGQCGVPPRMATRPRNNEVMPVRR